MGVYPQSFRLKFLNIFNNLKVQHNEFMALFEIMVLQKLGPSLEWSFFLHLAYKQVENVMQHKHATQVNRFKGINVMDIYRFESLYVDFELEIENSTSCCLEFWKELLKKNIDVNRLHNYGVQLSGIFVKITKIVDSLNAIYPQHIGMLKTYSLYLREVMNNESQALELYSRAIQIK